MLAELFARHPSCGSFEGNPVDVFGAFIAGEEYGLDETPELLGLYGGRYTTVFQPGELRQSVWVHAVEANPCLFFYPGVDFMSSEVDNDMLMVEHHSGESEMSDEEYECCLWRRDQLRPASGGRIFAAWTVGTRYVRQDVGRCTCGRKGYCLLQGCIDRELIVYKM